MVVTEFWGEAGGVIVIVFGGGGGCVGGCWFRMVVCGGG